MLPGSHHSAAPCLGKAFGASSKGLLDPPGTTTGHGGGGRLGAAGRGRYEKCVFEDEK